MPMVLHTSPYLNIAIQRRFRCTVLDHFCRLIAMTVSELFMTLAVPISAVLVTPHFAAHLLLLFSLGLYVCNYIKCTLKMPRPTIKSSKRSSPGKGAKQQRLEIIDHVTGYGFPSSHTLTAVSIPLFITHYYPELATGWASVLVSGLGTSIIFSRLYLGVHSLPDVVGGFFLGLGVFKMYTRVYDVLYTLDFAFLPLALFAAAYLLFWLHPQASPDSDDESLEESTIVLGCSTGGLIVLWRTALLAAAIGGDSLPYAPKLTLGALVLRVIVALASIAIAKVTGKEVAKVAVKLILSVLKVKAPASDVASNDPQAMAVAEQAKKNYQRWFSNLTRLISYPLLALAVLDVSPWLCSFLLS